MTKVMVVAEFAYFGGARTYFDMLMRYYATEKIEAIVALTRKQLTPDVLKVLEECGAKYVLIATRNPGFLRLWYRFPFSVLFDIFSLFWAVRKVRPDMIFVSNSLPGLYLGILALPYPCIYFLHAYPVQMRASTIKGRLREVAQKLFLDSIVSQRKLIATVSEYSKRRIANAWGSIRAKDLMRVMYNTSRFERSDFRRENRALGGPVRILTLGLVAWSKNPKLWIDIAERVCSALKDDAVEFIWAGSGDMLEECRTEVDAKGLSNCVKFIGYSRNVKELYNSADIYFQPSLLESQGLAVLDAMQAAIPCVVSDAGGLPESVDDGKTGYIVSLDEPNMMAERIALLVKDTKLRLKLGLHALELYEKKFSYDIWIRRMREIHNYVLS